jgi:hypothetical protein
MERKCEYRNCKKDISERRANVKYCDRNCKSCENKYIKRRKEQLEKYMSIEMKRVEMYKKLKEMIENK